MSTINDFLIRECTAVRTIIFTTNKIIVDLGAPSIVYKTEELNNKSNWVINHSICYPSYKNKKKIEHSQHTVSQIR